MKTGRQILAEDNDVQSLFALRRYLRSLDERQLAEEAALILPFVRQMIADGEAILAVLRQR